MSKDLQQTIMTADSMNVRGEHALDDILEGKSRGAVSQMVFIDKGDRRISCRRQLYNRYHKPESI